MEALNVSSFRNGLSASFDRADNGEKVLIRRGRRMYALVSLGDEDLTLSPALLKRLAEAKLAHRQGESHVCHTPEEIEDFLTSL